MFISEMEKIFTYTWHSPRTVDGVSSSFFSRHIVTSKYKNWLYNHKFRTLTAKNLKYRQIFLEKIFFLENPSAAEKGMAKYDSKVKRCLDEFSLELYHHIASWPEVVPRNLCLSPLSISAALMMTYLGAKETTQMEIESALRLDKHFGENKEDLILEAFKEVFPILCPPITDHQNYTIALANKFYIKEGLQLKPGFVASVMKKLKSEVNAA